MTCPECKEKEKIFYDSHHDIIFCMNCGLVLTDNLLEKEKFNFHDQPIMERKTRGTNIFHKTGNYYHNIPDYKLMKKK